MQHVPHDYEVPVFRALTEPMLVMGVHRETAVALWGMSVMLVFAGHKFSNAWVLLLAAAVHGLLAWLTRRDPNHIAVLGRAIFSPRKLEP